jgi:hypothetical protein
MTRIAVGGERIYDAGLELDTEDDDFSLLLLELSGFVSGLGSDLDSEEDFALVSPLESAPFCPFRA